ncbi:hypothetical protein QNI16_01485 [Cytophagaceae bacterium YF14B1]|uniref:Uncharacterized protein n=1 Tax=Xanthocytophaga flava TaxID=3048013 RepID=A0AAE3U6Z1_9BACT|nr:hypothetical protein [Xanthocytophaga flavus]MDJ1479134.1 hypothetical protein [Xanthocytophaga flavus]
MTGQETLTTPYKSRIPVWRVDAVTEASFGKSNVTYWFNPELGFVKIMYQNYLKQKLTFELIGMKQYQ